MDTVVRIGRTATLFVPDVQTAAKYPNSGAQAMADHGLAVIVATKGDNVHVNPSVEYMARLEPSLETAKKTPGPGAHAMEVHV